MPKMRISLFASLRTLSAMRRTKREGLDHGYQGIDTDFSVVHDGMQRRTKPRLQAGECRVLHNVGSVRHRQATASAKHHGCAVQASLGRPEVITTLKVADKLRR